VHTLAELLALQPSLIVEAASHEAVREYALSIVEAGIDFLPMSVGAFAHGDLVAEITSKAEARGTKILISSGAIGGLDVLRASRAGGGLAQVTLTSTKRPAALANQPYLIEHKVSVEGLSGPTVVFDGSAREACQAFPKSTNIAASVSLAGIGFDLTRVRVVANPDIPRTTHTLEARGSFGELRLTLQNLPHPQNPSTTNLACQGAVATLGNMLTPICFL
jgi:aspartate dehydrogenase